METVLVPTDGSDRARRAERKALDVAEEEDATLYGLNVVDTRQHSETAFSSAELTTDRAESRGQAVLTNLEERAEERGVNVKTRVVHGVPHEKITEIADKSEADLVVLGTRRQAGVAHRRSVAEKISEEADTEVLVAS